MEEKFKKNNKIIYIIIGFLVFIFIVCMYIFFSKREETNVVYGNLTGVATNSTAFTNSLQIKNELTHDTIKGEETEEKAPSKSSNSSNTTKDNSVKNNSPTTSQKASTSQKETTTNKKTSNSSNSSTTSNKTNNKTSSTSITSSISVSNNDDTSENVWIGNTGTKYHRQSCGTLKGKGHKITLKEALAQGREPCKVCKP